MNPTLAFVPSGWEIPAIIFVVLLLFGAKKIPELARGLGRSVGEFKKAKGEFDREVQQAADLAQADDPAPSRQLKKETDGETIDVKPEPATQAEPRTKA